MEGNFFCWHFLLSTSLDTQQLGNRHLEAALLATGNWLVKTPGKWKTSSMAFLSSHLSHNCNSQLALEQLLMSREPKRNSAV